MAMPDDDDYKPCADCGDEWSETLENSGQPLCEECYNIAEGQYFYIVRANEGGEK